MRDKDGEYPEVFHGGVFGGWNSKQRAKVELRLLWLEKIITRELFTRDLIQWVLINASLVMGLGISRRDLRVR